MIYPAPDNDKKRIESLHSYNILDSVSEEIYDDISEMVAEICGCAVAYVNLIDTERHWMKSTYGLPDGFVEVPREIGFCNITICKTSIYHVPDVTKNEYMKNLGMVTGEPHFRFYCGAPLINSQGYVLGTLCVMDFRPKNLDIEKQDFLKKMAYQVVSLFELHKSVITINMLKDEQKHDKAISQNLLSNILPDKIITEFNEKGEVKPKYYQNATILFADFVNFTQFTRDSEPAYLINELHEYFSAFDEFGKELKIEKIKTIGDAYQCVCGLPESQKSHAIHVCLMALKMIGFLKDKNSGRKLQGQKQWHLRIGIHSGPLMAGVIGKNKFCFDLWGENADFAEKVQELSTPDHILVSEETMMLAKKTFEFSPWLGTENTTDKKFFYLTGLKKEYASDPEGLVPNTFFFKELESR